MAEGSKKNIILIGYRSSGKTAVGTGLAEKLLLPFYDTDTLICRRTGKSVREIVADKGWAGFRKEERIVIKSLTFVNGCVIALGGGAVMDPENLKVLRTKGVFIWLDADAGTIVERMENDAATSAQRPPLSGTDSLSEAALMLKEREPIYRLLARYRVDTTGKRVDEVVEEITDLIVKSFWFMV
jgi:shikimate kinase